MNRRNRVDSIFREDPDFVLLRAKTRLPISLIETLIWSFRERRDMSEVLEGSSVNLITLRGNLRLASDVFLSQIAPLEIGWLTRERIDEMSLSLRASSEPKRVDDPDIAQLQQIPIRLSLNERMILLYGCRDGQSAEDILKQLKIKKTSFQRILSLLVQLYDAQLAKYESQFPWLSKEKLQILLMWAQTS